MSIEKAKAYLGSWGLEDQVREFDVSSATVELAAKALGTQEKRIAKTMSFHLGDRDILIVAAGDARIDNRKFKDFFKTKARMIPPHEVKERIGYDVGGVCPFGINPGISVYLDCSLKRFSTVFPACGTASSAVELSPDRLQEILPESQWVDVCKDWE